MTRELDLEPELFGDDAFVEGVAGIEEHEEVDVARLLDFDADDVARFDVIGDRAHGALLVFAHGDGDAGVIGQQRAAPAAGAEGADRRQRQQFGVERQYGAVSGEIVRSRAGGRGNEQDRRR